MGNLRRIVGVGLAVALVAAFAVYVLIPKSGPTANNIVVNEPQNPTNGGSGSTTSGGSGTGGTPSGGGGSGGSGATPPPNVPPSGRPPKAHGENSHGPKHLVCLAPKSHPGNGVSEYQGANQYRGLCPAGSAQGAQGHGHHVLDLDAFADAAQRDTTFHVASTSATLAIE